MTTGYRHPLYAQSFAAFGRPVACPDAGAHLLARPIPGGGEDLSGPYPMLFAGRLDRLEGDLARLTRAPGGPVSVVFVLDPFADDPPGALPGFDVVRPFKTHFLTRLDRPWDEIASKHHRYHARRCARTLRAAPVADPASRADIFWSFFETLIRRRGLSGMSALSPEIVRAHLALPGVDLIEASDDGGPVAAGIWCRVGTVAYSHLQAMSPAGYAKDAGYALHRAALEHFRGRVEWLDLGGMAGTVDTPEDGLYRFKKGWATDARPSWLCGRILDRPRYAELVRRTGTRGAAFFPAYRAPRGEGA